MRGFLSSETARQSPEGSLERRPVTKMMVISVFIVAALWHCVRAARGRPAAEAAAVVAAGIAAMAIFNLFIDGFYQRHFWILLACAFGLPVFRPARRRATAVWRGEAAYGVS